MTLIELMKQRIDLDIQIFLKAWPFLLVLVSLCVGVYLFWKLIE